MKNNLLIDKDWELQAIDKICCDIRSRQFITDTTAILQLSYEYSGIMAQLVAHKLSTKDGPIDIEPVNIPYQSEFETTIHPNQLDPYDKLIVVDSGCLSGNNFKRVKNKLLDYGYSRTNLLFCCIACDLNSIFIPDICPIFFNGNKDMIHFWWETKTTRFNRSQDGR